MISEAVAAPDPEARCSEEGERKEILVLVHRSLGPLGETITDPVLAELCFAAQWRRLPLRYVASKYPLVRAVGTLPALVGSGAGGIVPRHMLLGNLAALDPTGYGEDLAAGDAAFCGFVKARLGKAISFLLWADPGVWEDYTRHIVAKSAPFGFGWLAAWTERRRRLALMRVDEPVACGAKEVALLGLPAALEAMVERLGNADFFGHAGSAGTERISRVDACAFGHLSVLYSIPCEPSSSLHKLLAGFPTLLNFCDRMDARFGLWPDPKSFLAAVPPDARMPGIARSSARENRFAASAPGARAGGQDPSKSLEWWEMWGWSRGGGKPAQTKARSQSPAIWHVVMFGCLATASTAGAVALGLGPSPAALRKALAALTSEGNYLQ